MEFSVILPVVVIAISVKKNQRVFTLTMKFRGMRLTTKGEPHKGKVFFWLFLQPQNNDLLKIVYTVKPKKIRLIEGA